MVPTAIPQDSVIPLVHQECRQPNKERAYSTVKLVLAMGQPRQPNWTPFSPSTLKTQQRPILWHSNWRALSYSARKFSMLSARKRLACRVDLSGNRASVEYWKGYPWRTAQLNLQAFPIWNDHRQGVIQQKWHGEVQAHRWRITSAWLRRGSICRVPNRASTLTMASHSFALSPYTSQQVLMPSPFLLPFPTYACFGIAVTARLQEIHTRKASTSCMPPKLSRKLSQHVKRLTSVEPSSSWAPSSAGVASALSGKESDLALCSSHWNKLSSMSINRWPPSMSLSCTGNSVQAAEHSAQDRTARWSVWHQNSFIH